MTSGCFWSVYKCFDSCHARRPFIQDWYTLSYRVKSGKFGHQVNSDTFGNSVNPDEMAPYEPSHQDFHCLLSLFNFYSNYSKIRELR